MDELGTCKCGRPAQTNVQTIIAPGKYSAPEPLCQVCMQADLEAMIAKAETEQRERFAARLNEEVDKFCRENYQRPTRYERELVKNAMLRAASFTLKFYGY